MNIEYLLFNCIILIFPFIGSLLFPKYLQGIHVKAALFGLLPSALLFIIYDHVVTNYFWSFNSEYILGIYIGKLPIEEVLFFFTVPFACLPLWHFSKKIFRGVVHNHVGYAFLVTIALILYFLSLDGKYYTLSMSIGLILLLFLHAGLQVQLFQQKAFWGFTAISMLLTLSFNFYLTTRPIILYNTQTMTNIRITTIPLEDFIFGFLLLSMTVLLYEYSSKKTTT